jgi:hypothetical protein
MSRFDYYVEKFLTEDNTGVIPSMVNRASTSAYDFTVELVKKLIDTGLMKPVDVRELIAGDDINKNFYFIWDNPTYKLSYLVKVIPTADGNFEVRIINTKDKTDITTIDQHDEETFDAVVDKFNEVVKKAKGDSEKPLQTSQEPSALPGGTAPAGTPGTTNTSNYLKGLQ